MARFAIVLLSLVPLFQATSTTSSHAARPSETLLPKTTKAYASVKDVDLLREKFEATQLGALVNDPVMKPFVEDLRRQIESKLGQTDVRLNIKLSDLKDVYGGEVCLAVTQPGGDVKQHALVLLVDVTGHLKQANGLLDNIAKQLAQQGAKRSEQELNGTTLVSYVLPRKRGAIEAQRAFYFVHEDRLVATDHEATAKEILSRFGDDDKDLLKDLPAFKATMDRCAKAFGNTPAHIRWFVEPFGYVETMRAAVGGRKKRGTDILKVLRHQGFDAIQGVGGFVSFSVGGNEAQHGTFIYAPPVVNTQGEKYKLAARMLDFPESKDTAPQVWVPDKAANYITLYWEMQKAFEAAKTLVDELAGAEVFEDVLEGLEEDPDGPKINVRRDLVQHLGKRVSFFSDHRMPISPTCERWCIAFQVTNAPVVARTLDKAMEADPDAKKRTIVVGERKQIVWEIRREHAPEDDLQLNISGPGFGEFEEEEQQPQASPLLDHAAFTVIYGQLMVTSHYDFMEEILKKAGKAPSLSKTKDYVRVADALEKLGAGLNALAFFTRSDKELHVNYELLRTGKMPQSKSLFGSLLNQMLGPEEKGVVREQQIDGSKMPEFEKIRKYLGPAGAFVDAEDDGWFVTGCLLKREEAETKASGQ